MDSDSGELQRTNQVRALQITVGALLLGIVVFGGIVVYLRESGVLAMRADLPIVSIVAAGYLATVLVLRPLLLATTLRAAERRFAETGTNSESAWLSVFGGQTLTGAALLEGGAFLFLVAYLLEGQPWALAGAGVMLGLIAYCHFPTHERVERFLARVRESA